MGATVLFAVSRARPNRVTGRPKAQIGAEEAEKGKYKWEGVGNQARGRRKRTILYKESLCTQAPLMYKEMKLIVSKYGPWIHSAPA